ncbi:MerR family transcriptional regulator [Nocardia paucivorans]|uniref:MerR family transcriptional regulator n=1 Tax=Nocardia paucivorans TaxID=114259 RepID=UPI000592796B|nr:MerR family transcriptional regulator [Nocardia paucivorans]
MRTGELARRSGYSVQQVRNLERDGVLPPATRTDSGYRVYTEIHLYSARAYRALAAGVGPVEAKRIMRTVHGDQPAATPALLDAAHARLHRERAELAAATAAIAAIADEPVRDVRPSDAMSVSELATALGVRASTLRHWDAEGLVVPDRVAPRGTRRYTPDQVRDARIVHQLRGAGYRVDTVRTLMSAVRRGYRSGDVTAGLAAREADIEARSRALLTAAGALDAVLTLVTGSPT